MQRCPRRIDADGNRSRVAMTVVILLVILGGTVGSAWGVAWQAYTESHGLPDNVVTAFAVGHRLMAVGTARGAAVFSPETGHWQPLSVPEGGEDLRINDLAFDAQDTLWAATPKGVVRFEPRTTCVFDASDGLPSPDVLRVQVDENRLYVGCFGGFVCSAIVPETGRPIFRPVNFAPSDPEFEDTKHLRSIHVTGLGYRGHRGWLATSQQGLLIGQGRNMVALDTAVGMPSDWITGFWVFPSRAGHERVLAATTDGLAMIQDQAMLGKVSPPSLHETGEGECWVTGLAVVPPIPPEEGEARPQPKDPLAAFLEGRSLWLGTRDGTLWRFENEQWQRYDAVNAPLLASKNINRVYSFGRRIAVCTDGGLVLLALDSLAFDELAHAGVGNARYKTVYQAGQDVPVTGIAPGNGLWLSTLAGLKRYSRSPRLGQAPSGPRPFSPTIELPPLKAADQTDESNEEIRPEKRLDAPPKVPISAADSSLDETFFSKETNTFPFDRFTWIHLDHNRMLWSVVEEKYLFRARVLPRPGNSRGRIVWDFLNDQDCLPWQNATKLTSVWSHEQHLYLGTRTEGFFRLKNPGEIGSSAARLFEWQHFGPLEGLRDLHVLQFAVRRPFPGKEPLIYLLHPTGLTSWDGRFFRIVDVGTDRQFFDMAADEGGRLWLASDKGLLCVQPDGVDGVSEYTRRNAGFDSNRITAVGVSSRRTGFGCSLWVACDDIPSGCDQRPIIISGGRLRECGPTEPERASLHYFDGLTWEKYEVGGVRRIVCDGDYVFFGTNIRLLRWYKP